MTETRCALYARVSSEAQARDNTIASQVMVLQERVAADGFELKPDHSYLDEGYSGSILLRPALDGCGMPLPVARSTASMSTPRIGLLAATPIRRC